MTFREGVVISAYIGFCFVNCFDLFTNTSRKYWEGNCLGIKKFNIWRYSELFCTEFEDERGLNGRDDMR